MNSLLSSIVESFKSWFGASPEIELVRSPKRKEDLSRGWGDDIKWKTLSAGEAEALNKWRPMMVVLHWMSCGGCRWMKRVFSESDRIRELSEDFVMVNLLPQEIPKVGSSPDPKYAPDGWYVPRFLFFSPEGKFLPHVKGMPDGAMGSANRFQYTYPQEHDIFRSMQKVSSMKFEKPIERRRNIR